jgi:hypothetical protein
MTPTSRSRCRCLPGFSLATHGLALADLTGLLLTRDPEQPGQQQQPAGEEDGEQGQALHQSADVVQRPRVGEDQHDGGQHDDDTEDASGEGVAGQGMPAWIAREPVRQHDERHGSGCNRIGCQRCSGTWPASCTAEKALLSPAMSRMLPIAHDHAELEQSLGVVAWLEEGRDLGDASPQKPKPRSTDAFPSLSVFKQVIALIGTVDGCTW